MQAENHNDKAQLIDELRTLIVGAVNLHHLPAEQFKADTQLAQGGLNLDSVDLLEIVVAVEQKFDVKVDGAEVGRKYFHSLNGIADFILETRG